MREQLHELLRVARFENWDSRRLVDEILRLVGLEGVDDQPAPPDQ
jgi:hypothetical protein